MKKFTNMKKIGLNNNFEKEIIEKIKLTEEEIKRGEGIDADIVFQELRQKYGY